MWNPISVVARSQFLSEEKLAAFVQKPGSVEKYGLAEIHGELQVNTWHVDLLLRNFKESLPPGELEQDRKAAIAERREQNRAWPQQEP